MCPRSGIATFTSMEHTLRRALVVLTLVSLLASSGARAATQSETTGASAGASDVASTQPAVVPWPDLEPGTRLRLRTSARGRRIEGRLVAIEDGHLRLDRRGHELRVSLDSIHGLQAARGTKNRLARGLLIGGLAAVFAGELARLGCEGSCTQSSMRLVPQGLAVGALLGAVIRVPHWQPVCKPGGPRAQISVAPLVDPRRRGYGLGVSARF